MIEKKLRSATVLIVGLLPPSGIKNILLRQMGWEIGANVQIGPSLFIRLDQASLADGAKIGAFNVIRSLAKIELGSSARLGQWNWISAATPLRDAGAPGCLTIGAHSAITSRHYIDASGGVHIGAFSTIAGVRSTMITHGISWKSSRQTFKGVTIGDYCLISSNVSITPGTLIESRVVVGMGATVAGVLKEGSLYVTERATLVKSSLTGEYFVRDLGFISEVTTNDPSVAN